MDFKDLSPELREKACSCHTVEELHELINEEGMEIPDEELEGIAGGAWCDAYKFLCPAYSCSTHNNPNCKA